MSKAIDLPKLSKKNKFDEGLGQVTTRKEFSETFSNKISETNSSFHVKERTMGKSLIPIFQNIFTNTNKIFILAGGLGTLLSFCEV